MQASGIVREHDVDEDQKTANGENRRSDADVYLGCRQIVNLDACL
jgi:hypothetical protein